MQISRPTYIMTNFQTSHDLFVFMSIGWIPMSLTDGRMSFRFPRITAPNMASSSR